MNAFADSAGTWHSLSIAAMEEASRVGQRVADIDHLLLALTLSEHLAGQILRSEGVTLDAARTAIGGQHADQLASLGVRAPVPERSPLAACRTDGCVLSERAIAVLTRSAEDGRRGDAGAVLRELLAEPSGLIQAVLGRIGVECSQIAARLDEFEAQPDHPLSLDVRPDALTITRQAFVPAAPEQIWDLLSTPSRMPEWEMVIGSIDDAPPRWRAGGSAIARARTADPDGKPIRVRPDLIEQRIEVVAAAEPRLIAWRFTCPLVARANTRFLEIDIEPAAGGARLNLTHAWERPRSRARGRAPSAIGRGVRQLYQPVLWLQVTRIGANISRVLR